MKARRRDPLSLLLLLGALVSPDVLATQQDPARPFDPDEPAREVYKNIQIFVSDQVTASYLDQLMDEISIDLGVPCTHCHDAQALHRADLDPEKTRARELIPHMWSVVSEINRNHFPGSGAPVRCWTCHRGSPTPQLEPSQSMDTTSAPDPFANGSFENLQILSDLESDELRQTMQLFVTSLGADCTDCHVTDDWANDSKELKQRARVMLAMVDGISMELFSELSKPSCWTCHRGHRKPEFLRPE